MYVRSLAEELMPLGWDVIIAAPSTKEKEEMYDYDGIKVYRYPISLRPSQAEVKGDIKPKYIEVFIKRLREFNPDLVHMHSYTGGCGSFHAHAIKELGIPLVFTLHIPGLTCARGTMMRWGIVPCDGEMRQRRCAACYLQDRKLPKFLAWAIALTPSWFTNYLPDQEGRYITVLKMRKIIQLRIEKVKEFLRMTDRIVVVSKWMYETLRLNGVQEVKLFLSRHGLSNHQISVVGERPESDVLRVGFIGRFVPIKGIHILIEAMKRLPLDVRAELYIYGRPIKGTSEEAYSNDLKRAASGEKRVIFCGEMTDQNRKESFGNLDLVAVPSIWFEAGPLVVLEAFSAGIPVIGSNLGGISEIVGNGVNGLLVEVGNVNAWAHAINLLASNRDLLLRLKKGVTTIRSSRDVAKEMINIYESALKK